MVEIDLHGLFLDDAIDIILEKVEELNASGETQVTLVHGYNRGHIIKQWIWSQEFSAELTKIGIALENRSEVACNPGATIIQFR